jgi:hypothetical protein
MTEIRSLNVRLTIRVGSRPAKGAGGVAFPTALFAPSKRSVTLVAGRV